MISMSWHSAIVKLREGEGEEDSAKEEESFVEGGGAMSHSCHSPFYQIALNKTFSAIITL